MRFVNHVDHSGRGVDAKNQPFDTQHDLSAKNGSRRRRRRDCHPAERLKLPVEHRFRRCAVRCLAAPNPRCAFKGPKSFGWGDQEVGRPSHTYCPVGEGHNYRHAPELPLHQPGELIGIESEQVSSTRGCRAQQTRRGRQQLFREEARERELGLRKIRVTQTGRDERGLPE